MIERRSIAVEGLVQGVGFRPFVYALATRLGLGGRVLNRSDGLWIEVEGARAALDRFLAELTTSPPRLAQISGVRYHDGEPHGDAAFAIDASADGHGKLVYIQPDIATCDACLTELFDPGDRRHRYPFLNCTACGPRLTIVTGVPYDRQRTTMAAFPLCDDCRRDYEDPANRRFHAQPTACPACGPRLMVSDAQGRRLATDSLAAAVASLRAGQIVAVKGLGGYHLACDATDDVAVARLRARKQRDEKPLAVMVADEAAAAELGVIGPAERALLTSWRRPIVLLRRRAGAPVADHVAFQSPWLGVMLPYTPLHHLLLKDVQGRPLVMTSGNRADDPIVIRDEEASRRLAGIADLFLGHDRPIRRRCDDSVARIVAGAPSLVRRSRGLAPEPLRLPVPCPFPLLAVGGHRKATFALGRGHDAFLSHHLGDLDQVEALRAFGADLRDYEALFGLSPQLVAHDLHPDYATTRYVETELPNLKRLAVQHHHAHMASCMADNGLVGPAIGVCWDGSGYGLDGAIWGGEFLVGDYASVRRAAHLRDVGLPGGERAVSEPWRMALSYLHDAEAELPSLAAKIGRQAWSITRTMIERRINTPRTTSAGRLFDAVAALAGGRAAVSSEGQAAIELEWLATAATDVQGAYAFDLAPASAGAEPRPLVVDTRPLIRDVAAAARRGADAGTIARRFHLTLVEVIVQVCTRLRQATAINVIVLSGGVFLNALLTELATVRLADAGFHVHRHRRVPPNDGGLSLGQLAVAAARSTRSDLEGAHVPRNSW